ncbi:FHA domain-containing serine/threonine-protein kinase [Candidatus Uabimicrobium sp. HlEnr_7]|uniref:FHA domain-containing serine/threonine-protein kinase n=1 Tax=Candidatus Uabimicrobium helgolandensis TaxID=3095367 RepID=UPI00355811D6
MSKKTFGEYTIISTLGQGAMGKVYFAQDINGNDVALKIILPKALEQAGEPQDVIQRFRRESKLALSLQHPNIVRTYDTGEVDGTLYLACEVVNGGDLEDKMKSNCSFSFIVNTMANVLTGLEELHEKNFVHRDIKPANILIDRNGTAKISDLGMLRSTADDRTMYTQEGQILGTPYYISPEQVRGEKNIDIRCDLYAFGAMFYQCLEGMPPFTGGSLLEILQKHLEFPIPKFENPEVSKELASFISSLLSKNPNDRPPTPLKALEILKSIVNINSEVFKDNSQDNNNSNYSSSISMNNTIMNSSITSDTVIGLPCLAPINSDLKAVLSRAKITSGKQTIFVYGKDRLQIGRNAIDIDNQDICLRLLPGRGQEQKNQSISGKHFSIYIENNNVFIVDLGSRAGTKVNGEKLVAKEPKRVENKWTMTVADLIELECQIIPHKSQTSNEIIGQGIITETSAVLIKRINNTPEHLYVLAPGKFLLANVIDNAPGDLEIFYVNNALGYNSKGVCSLFENNSSISTEKDAVHITSIAAADQK